MSRSFAWCASAERRACSSRSARRAASTAALCCRMGTSGRCLHAATVVVAERARCVVVVDDRCVTTSAFIDTDRTPKDSSSAGRSVTASHVWSWSPKHAAVAGHIDIAIETFVTLTAAAGYLRAPSTSVHLVTASGARIPVADAGHSTCADPLALGETRRCSFLFQIPVTEKPERLEIHVAPEPAIAIAIANPPATSGPCVVDAPCTPCSFPVSGMECQNEARARGLEPTCSFNEDAGLGRKITLYCPPGYRRRDPSPPLGR